jgi:hypothetical protein
MILLHHLKIEETRGLRRRMESEDLMKECSNNKGLDATAKGVVAKIAG